MMSPPFEALLGEYVTELRESKAYAESWWRSLQHRHVSDPAELSPEEVWPLGPVSHPRVIATYRRFYFRCAALNVQVESNASPFARLAAPLESDWGMEEPSTMAETVEPKTFVLDLLAGGETHDLYEFLLSLSFVPIGLKNDEPV